MRYLFVYSAYDLIHILRRLNTLLNSYAIYKNILSLLNKINLVFMASNYIFSHPLVIPPYIKLLDISIPIDSTPKTRHSAP